MFETPQRLVLASLFALLMVTHAAPAPRRQVDFGNIWNTFTAAVSHLGETVKADVRDATREVVNHMSSKTKKRLKGTLEKLLEKGRHVSEHTLKETTEEVERDAEEVTAEQLQRSLAQK